MPIKVSRPTGPGGSSKGPPNLSTRYLDQFSNLLEFLSCGTSGGDWKPVPGSITLTWKDGRWSARLKDPGAKQYCYFVDGGLDGVLEGVELALGENTLDWRVDQEFQPRRGK